MIRLHHVPFSRSFRVLWMLEELGLEADIVPYSITDGSLRALAKTGVSPAGRIPVLEMEGQTICESSAILQFLADSHPEAGFDRRPGHPDRIGYLEMMSYAETMASLIENLNLNRIFLRDPAQASPVVIKLLTARLSASLDGFSRKLDGEYILPSGISAADIMMGFNLFAAPHYVRFDPWPNLLDYVARISERPAFKTARAKDGKQEFYTEEFYPLPDAG